ncbi:MAG: DEAD-box ATP-dependent RNA helicase CshA [Acidimicrobiales bacterium]|nr:MAG: DEAD/DEAH box helicase [Actinomycetota bacterium]MBV6509121.1 DEAD-box ATP-dependent RNA helicase CshA [Acidimicrobiales bacterium]RIK08617.1 MAG: RNA helicase [Acidobacteriota bacterium]
MTKTFEGLGVAEDLVDALAERGITEPFPIQELAIPDGLKGKDICGKAKTGSGKTLAFGLPVIENCRQGRAGRPTALCLVPTRELAVQVHDELRPLAAQRNVRMAVIYGGADIDKQVKRLRKGVDFVVGTPGRMIDLIDRNELAVNDLTQVVLDEADRMADMGFMPQVEWILRNVAGDHQTYLFSATLDGAVNGLIQRYQTDPARHEVASKKVTVDEMHHRFLLVHEMDKVKVAAAIARAQRRTLVFVATKHGADRLARKLQKEGIEAAAIHGDLRQRQREGALRDFADGKLEALVATDVAARGIHVDEVDVVIHYDPPSDHKAYLHRSGRTARAGETGVVVSLVLWNQELELRRLQRRIGVSQPIVEVFSNDRRLGDLAGWNPSEGENVA